MANYNLTIKTVSALKGAGLVAWDQRLPGFGVRVAKDGSQNSCLSM